MMIYNSLKPYELEWPDRSGGPWEGASVSGASVNRQSLSDQVAQILRGAILAGEYRAGQRLSEPELAKRLNVSLTPVREALGTLAGTGLVVRSGRQGTHVRELDVRDVENLLSVREALEAVAVRQCIGNLTSADATRLEAILTEQEEATTLARTDPAEALPQLAALNEEFHALILERTGNEWLATMLASIHDLLVFARARLRSHATPERRQQSLDEHRRIAAALIGGDADTAVRCMSEHLHHLKRHVIALALDRDAEVPSGRGALGPEGDTRARAATRAHREAGEEERRHDGDTATV
jgi:DNA-binding GntR family transcriptional regulator